MKKLWLLLPLLLLLSACGTAKETSSKQETKDLKKVTFVLDYVPNTNHTGIYLAKEKGYYKEAGLNVQIIEPGDNSTSIGLVGADKAQFGVSYQEDVTYAHADGQNIPVKAIATVIKHNTSGFATLSDSNIHSPKDFEGKTYAGWQSPSEEAVLKAVMEKDGGDFSKLTMVGSNGEGPESLGKSSDIQWYFEGWDMIKAKEAGIELNYIPLKELDERLDYYTPVIITNDQLIKSDPELVQSFMDATKKGYQEAIKDPNDSAKLLQKYAKENDRTFLEESQAFLSKNYTDNPENWGLMEEKVWRNYTAFMQENGLIKQDVPSQELFTNQFIK
ncbi:ABC transporter substrate-binding protein [Enterococcus faecium]|uniref:ABC transporter substrate-binding protein n=1 Tax=Enterococcus faecium TaxID=1352 RepID=UPI00338F1240